MATSTGEWRCSGASVVGRSHEREGLCCQDAWAKHRSDNCAGTVLAACVCDGAGSAKSAQTGAELVSTFLARWLAENFDKVLAEHADALFEAFSAIREAMGQRAGQENGALGDYACTVVAVAVRDDGQWVAWHLGDGGIIAQFSETIRVLSAPKKGEFANVTHFITDDDAYAQVGCYNSKLCNEAESPLGFVLFTDGVEMSLFVRKTGEVAPAVAKILGWHELADEEQVSAAIRENLRDVFRGLTGDDCTIVMLRWCVGAASVDSGEKPANEQTA